ncbi:MAG TPA: dephospho-CoA kinase [Verrucomicrobiae bacterium]|nr:dephospho-CoA kinase [Verrucomicrobiae bacterium]
MKLWGLTGGVGMGKSTLAAVLRNLGFEVVDTDSLAREFTRPGEQALSEIVRTFGSSIVDEKGELRRGALADLVFSDSSARHRLHEILHPRIRNAWKARLMAWRRAGIENGVVVIPLLFETNAEEEFDHTLCVACSTTSQWNRLSARNWISKHIEQRIASQMPIEEKMQRSTFVVWTEGPMEITVQQVKRILAHL